MWNNDDDDPDRMERPMAEFLVHCSLPFWAFMGIRVRSAVMEERVGRLLSRLDTSLNVAVRPGWYFEREVAS